MGKNAGEWTGRVEISKEEIPGSNRGMYEDKGQTGRSYKAEFPAAGRDGMTAKF